MTADWIDRTDFPFAPRYLEVDGGRMHYVDEGEGPAIVLVHGTPTWSFLYRKLIKRLSRDHRVIAPDHIGFGLSAKPENWSYRPADHARNLAALLESLNLGEFDLVVHDFGGPIGLSYAIEHPGQIRSLVLFNTFLWSNEDNPTAVRASKFFGGAVGRFLYTRLNLSPKYLIPLAFGDKRKLAPAVHRQYVGPFRAASERMGTWTLAKELIGSSRWFDGLWNRRAVLDHKPALLLWGMKDPAFGPSALERWEEVLMNADVRRFDDAGHFVMEEVKGVDEIVAEFLENAKASVETLAFGQKKKRQRET